MAKFLGIDVTQSQPIKIDSTESGPTAVTKTPSATTKPSRAKALKTFNKTEQFVSPSPLIIQKHERKASLNESLDSSINAGSSVSKLHKKNQKGETPLQVVSILHNMSLAVVTNCLPYCGSQACIKQDIQQVKDLLILGANPNTQDNAGWTPLVYNTFKFTFKILNQTYIFSTKQCVVGTMRL